MKIKNVVISLLVITSMLMSNVYAVDNAENIYVSATNGSDLGDGTYASPLKTLEAAKKKVARIEGSSAVNVNIMAGTYNISDLKFNELDSGSDGAEIVWKAYNNDEVILTSEQKLDNSRITDVNSETIGKIPQLARGNVKQIKLTQEEINAIGPIRYTGQKNSNNDAPAYLTQDGKMFEIAGYPNKVNMTIPYANINLVSEEIGDKIYKHFEYTITDSDDKKRISSWSDANDAYLVGNPTYEWWDEALEITDITDSKIITSDAGEHGIKYSSATLRIVNLVEEIDYPGEFYIDRQEGYLYFYPLDTIADSSFSLVTSQKPLMTFNKAQYISFENLIFEGTCSTGIIIKNSDNITLKNCEMRNIGKNAIDIKDSKNTTIEGAHIHDIGKQGITLNGGGDFSTLTPSNNVIKNCHIERYGKVLRRNANAINANGIGDKISNNRIHAAEHSAIMFSGNNNIIEYNDIYDVLNKANDAGVIYGGRSWVDGGTQIRYNYIHDNPYTSTLSNNKSGVYLDDSFAGTTVEGNVFANMNAGVKLHGSQYNNIKNNVFINLTSSVRLGNLNGESDTSINKANIAINEKLMKGEDYFKSDDGYKSLTDSMYRGAHTLYGRYFEKFDPYNTETDAYKTWDEKFPYLKGYIDPTGMHMTPKGNVIENNNTFTGGYSQIGGEAIYLATYEDKGDTTQNIVNNNTNEDNNVSTSSVDVKNNGVLDITKTGIVDETGLTLNDFGVVYPKNQAYVEPGDQVLIWDEDSGADKYKLIISQNESLSDPIVNTYIEDNYYLYEGLTAGTYYWTVDAETNHHLYTNKIKRINEGVMSFKVADNAGVVTLSNIVYRNGDGNKINAIENGTVNVVEFDLANNYSTGTTAVATLESYDGNGNKIGEAKVTKDFEAYESVRAGVGIATSTDANAYMMLTIESGNSSSLEYRIDNAAMAGQEEEDKLAITSVTINSGAIVNGAENAITAVVKSLADGQQTVRCIMATYDSKGMLVDSDTDQFTMTKGDDHTFNTEALVSSDAGAYVKLFFWNDKMMPFVTDYDVE